MLLKFLKNNYGNDATSANVSLEITKIMNTCEIADVAPKITAFVNNMRALCRMGIFICDSIKPEFESQISKELDALYKLKKHLALAKHLS